MFAFCSVSNPDLLFMLGTFVMRHYLVYYRFLSSRGGGGGGGELLRKHLVTIMHVFVMQELDTLEEHPGSRMRNSPRRRDS